MGFSDNIFRVWSINTIRLSKYELYEWRNANWDNNSTAMGIISTAIGIAGLAEAIGLGDLALATGMTFAGMGGYIGNQIDDILRYNNCEDGIDVFVEFEVTTNVTYTESKSLVVTDLKVG